MIRQVILFIFIGFCLLGCNISSKYLSKNAPSCSSYFELEKAGEIYFIENKEFKKISNLLVVNYGAIEVRQIVYFKPQDVYYCEFYKNDYTVKCLLLDNDMKLISKENLEFDY